MKTQKDTERFRGKSGCHIDRMSPADLDQLAKECENLRPEDERPLTRKQQAQFDAWQHDRLELRAKGIGSLTLIFPDELTVRLGALARKKHTTPANLVKRIVHDALHQAVA